MGRTPSLANPIAMTAVGVVPIVRGVGYVIVECFPDWSISVGGVGPSLPFFPLTLMGIAWITLGVLWFIAMWKCALIKLVAALTMGGYATWTIIYAVDLMVAPDIISLTSLAGYIAMIPLIATLAEAEMDQQARRSLGLDTDDGRGTDG